MASTSSSFSPSSFAFQVGRDRGSVVVTVSGPLDLQNAIGVGAVLADLIDGQGNLDLVVDLSRASGIDGSGLGVFAAAATLAGGRGGRLRLRVAPGHRSRVTRLPRQPNRHLVEFYGSEDELARSVAEYLEPGLRRDEAAVVVATRPHRDLFEAGLAGMGVDVEGARSAGRYADVDAQEMLERFMVEGLPDPGRFDASIGDLVDGQGAGGRPVRIYGEMVWVLWDEGNVAGALALEDLWNDLAESRPFSLLCAYPVRAFDRPDAAGSFRRICRQHS